MPESVLERDYCLAWLLVGISRTSLRELLAFQGGTALKRCYFGDYRFSEDLDFTLAADTSFDVIRREFELAFAEIRRESGLAIVFPQQDQPSHRNSHTFFLGYEGPLPATVRPKQIKVDITIKEDVVFALEQRKILRAYAEYEDLPEDAEVSVYALGEIAAEKVVALLDGARNEPRDLYDIWFLTSDGHVDLCDVTHAIERKWEFRGRRPLNSREALMSKEARYKKLWELRLLAQMVELPEFAVVFRSVRRTLREAKIIGK